MHNQGTERTKTLPKFAEAFFAEKAQSAVP